MMKRTVPVSCMAALGTLLNAPGCGRPGHEDGATEISIRADFQQVVSNLASLRESKINGQLDWESDRSDIHNAVLAPARTDGASWIVLIDADWWDDESRRQMEDGSVRLIISSTATVFEFRDGMFTRVEANDLASDKKWFVVPVGFLQ
jgi:hypothetical protein